MINPVPATRSQKIRVRSQEYFICFSSRLFQIGDNFTFAFDGYILGGELFIYINAQLAHRQIPNVAY